MRQSMAWRVSSGRVEDGRGSLGPMANAPFPIPAHQTERADFRHSAFRLASPKGTRRVTNRTRHLRSKCLSFAPRYSSLGQRLSFDGVLRLIANHHDLAIFESTPEVRALCSAGVTRPQRSYDPVRLRHGRRLSRR